MKSFCCKPHRVLLCALLASAVIWSASTARGKNHDSKFAASEASNDAMSVEAATGSPQAAATPSGTPAPQIDATGTIVGASGRTAQFFIFDVEDEQVTPQFLEGEFGYMDRKAHINFTTGKIQTVTINGNQGAFTGTARIGGPRNRQTVQFTVTVTANQSPASSDTFSIVLSNGYAASGSLTSGQILIRTLDPD